MKSGKNPTRRQKQSIQEAGLNSEKWLVFKVIEDQLHLTHRETGRTKVISV